MGTGHHRSWHAAGLSTNISTNGIPQILQLNYSLTDETGEDRYLGYGGLLLWFCLSRVFGAVLYYLLADLFSCMIGRPESMLDSILCHNIVLSLLWLLCSL